MSSRHVKVLHVLSELRPSGAEVMLKLSAGHWTNHGIQAELVSTASGPSTGPYSCSLKGAGYNIHHLPMRRNLSYLMSFYSFIRKERFDVVHQHLEAMSFWLCLAALLAGAKVLRTVHSEFRFEGKLRRRRSAQRRFLSYCGVKFVAISESVLLNERSRFGISPRLVGNWIDVCGFAPINPEERNAARKRLGISEDEVALITVGNCSSVKNHEILLLALSRIRLIHRVRYIHVGAECDECPERELAEKVGISAITDFRGWTETPRSDLSAADLYVMPSLAEGFGMSALEAISAGLPAMLARTGGLLDFHDLSDRIYYFEPVVEDLEKELLRVIAILKGPKPMASKREQIDCRQYSAELGVDRYCDLYGNLIRKAQS